MQNAELKALADAAEAAALDTDLETRLRDALRKAALPHTANFGSADAVLGLIDAALPGWAITLEGTASPDHGSWTCTLRRSRMRDNDEVIGVGKAQHLHQALLGALIRTLSFGAKP